MSARAAAASNKQSLLAAAAAAAAAAGAAGAGGGGGGGVAVNAAIRSPLTQLRAAAADALSYRSVGDSWIG